MKAYSFIEGGRAQRPGYLKPWLFGIAAGSLFVGFEAFLGFYPPAAYAFCLVCHTRDLVNSVVNALAGAAFPTAAVAQRAYLLTSPAVLIGAALAARIHGERALKKSGRIKAVRPPGHDPFGAAVTIPRSTLFYLTGFAVMSTGIVIFGCPTRLTIRAAYGDVYGIIGVAGMFLGIWLGTAILRARAGSAPRSRKSSVKEAGR